MTKNNNTSKELNIIFILLSMFFGCSSVPDYASSKKNHKKDILIENLSESASGMIVLKDKPLYTLKFTSPGKLDLFTFRTCSREISLENAGGRFKKNQVIINYRPNEIERSTLCPVDIGAYEQKKGRHSWGFIDFEDERTRLKAKLVCGEELIEGKTVTVCQGRKHLLTSIEFESEVIVKNNNNCKLSDNDKSYIKGKKFLFKLPLGQCVFAFMKVESPNEVHRLNTYGYDKILIREN